MPAPPSRAGWIWQVAAAAAERAQGLGSAVDDLRIDVTNRQGAIRVVVDDIALPAILAECTMPVHGAPDELRQQLRAAIAAEIDRLRRPPPLTDEVWREYVQEASTVVRSLIRPQSLLVRAVRREDGWAVTVGDSDGDVFERPLLSITEQQIAAAAAKRLYREIVAEIERREATEAA